MELLCSKVIFFVLLMAGIARSQSLGELCQRPDRSRGVCRNIKDCVDQHGQLEGATRLKPCTSSSLNRIVVCCRPTADIIARRKCDEWKREASSPGAPCTFSIPLARGGTTAVVGEFPHMVSILVPSGSGINGRLTHICGGTLISKSYVLTAAHCLQGGTIYASIGGHDLNAPEDVTRIVEVVQTIVHPGYRDPRRYNDIALLRLAFEVQFSKRIRPACLPSQNKRIRSGTKMVVAGWGAYENGGPTSNVLRKAEVSAIDRFNCDKSPIISDISTSIRYPAGITDSIICANERESGSCKGDSGGPLMVAGASTCEVKEVVGIVSRGVVECKKTDVPGTYTRIEYYLDWIVRTVWADEL